MEHTIKETTRLLLQGTLTKDEADKILLDLYNVSGRSEQVGCDNCADWKQGNEPDKYCLVCNRMVEL